MGNIEQDVLVLDKLLNSKLFLNKFPIIDRVWVDKYGKGIDVVLIPNDTKEYFKIKDKINSYIWEIIRVAGVDNMINVYP